MSSESPRHSRGELIDQVLAQVRPLVLNSARVIEAMWRPEGITVGMRAVLQILHEQGPMPVPAIAERLDLARQGVQRHVNDLSRLALVQPRPNPGHQRSVLIAITGRGQDLFRQIRRAELDLLDAHTAADCTKNELATALRVLTALNRDVRERAMGLREGS
jgi:DNA-binding MarR family transcriptional regulator